MPSMDFEEKLCEAVPEPEQYPYKEKCVRLQGYSNFETDDRPLTIFEKIERHKREFEQHGERQSKILELEALLKSNPDLLRVLELLRELNL